MLHFPISFIHSSREIALKQMAFALISSLSKIPLQRGKGVTIQVQGLYISTKKHIEGVDKQIVAITERKGCCTPTGASPHAALNRCKQRGAQEGLEQSQEMQGILVENRR
jgi:hypothetical protein